MAAQLGIVVLAVEEEAGGLQLLLPDMAELIWGIFGFAALMAFMFWKVFPQLNNTLEQRAARIQGQIEEAQQQRDAAERLRARYEEQLASARDEAGRILEEAREQAERIRADAAARAEEESQQVVARAREDVAAERGRLVSDLRVQVAALSVELAGKIVQRELDPARHEALVDQYISELSGLN